MWNYLLVVECYSSMETQTSKVKSYKNHIFSLFKILKYLTLHVFKHLRLFNIFKHFGIMRVSQ